MAESLRPRRSVLYMPGANERALAKAETLPADALILDLEDAVAPDAKAEARDRVCEAAASDRYGRREATIRVNGIGTPWHDGHLRAAVARAAKGGARGRAGAAAVSDGYGRREATVRLNAIGTPRHDADLRAVGAAGPAAAAVPKLDSAAAVHGVVEALEKAGAPAHTAVWAMIETPIAMLRAEEICRASERLTVLVMGTNDLAKELQAEHVPGRQPLLTGLGLSLLAARATGKVILDGVYNDITDAEGFEAECVQGRQMGFDGK